MSAEFLLEKRLVELSPDLSKHYKSVFFVMRHTLKKMDAIFSDFTDHTLRHSMVIIERANQVIGEDQVRMLNADEIYILLCAACLHDVGMSIDLKRYEELKGSVVPDGYCAEHPNESVKDAIRKFHNFFSEKIIYRYESFFEFPSPEHTYCIAQVAKGHRVTDLYDETEYDSRYRLPNGSVVRLPYLAAILRLCDEMDIAIDRNTASSYAEHSDVMFYKQHFAIKRLHVADDRFLLDVETGEENVRHACVDAIAKLDATLHYCADVASKRTEFTIRQKSVEIRMHDLGKRTAIILDTDTGIDDAMSFALMRGMGDFKPNFIIATCGNSGISQSVRNAIVLKKMCGLDATIVRGESPEGIENVAEKSTFHGPDGLAGFSSEMIERFNVSDDELKDYISVEELKGRLTECESILYISTCPLSSFCSIYSQDDLKEKFTHVYLTGYGFNELNGPHYAGCDFLQSYNAVKQILNSGLDTMLFPLEIASRQTLAAAEIDRMASNGANPVIIELLRYNMAANMHYNGISEAVFHDVAPVLFLCEPEKFTIAEKRIVLDERGTMREDVEGPVVKVAVGFENGLLFKHINEAASMV